MAFPSISVADWCYYGKLAEGTRYYETLKECGVDGVEMVPPERQALARAAGLSVITMAAPGMGEGLNRVEHHGRLLPELRAAIAEARDRGIPLLIIFSGNRAGQRDEEGIESCRRGIEAVLPEAENAGVVLGFEMLNTFDHADYQADHGAYGFRLASQVNSPWLRLVYDIYHMERMGDDSAADIVRHRDLIAHLHIAESPHRDMPRASGVIPYGRIGREVLEAGYAGRWGLECIPRGDPLRELRESVDMLRAIAATASPTRRSGQTRTPPR